MADRLFFRPRAMFWQSVVLLVLVGATQRLVLGPPQDLSDPEGTARAVSGSLAQGDWQGFLRLTITSADFDLREQQVSSAKASMSYMGGVLKPQQQADLADQFASAQALDFEWRGAKFAGLGQRVDVGTGTSLQGQPIECESYGLRLKVDGKTIDTSNTGPWFVLAKWREREWRLLRIVFTDS